MTEPGYSERFAGLPRRALPGGLTVVQASTGKARRRGLARLDALPPDHALAIPWCPAVHTFGMRFSLDLIWLARDGSSESARGVFIATIIGNTVGLIIVIMGTTAGTLNSMGWVAALIYLFGAAGSGYFVMARSSQLSSR